MYQMWQGCSSYVRTHGPRVAPDLGSRCVVGEGRGEAATRIPTKAAAPALDSNANRLREVWHDLCVWFVTRSTFRSDFAFTMPDTTDRSRCDFLFRTFCARIQTAAYPNFRCSETSPYRKPFPCRRVLHCLRASSRGRGTTLPLATRAGFLRSLAYSTTDVPVRV